MAERRDHAVGCTVGVDKSGASDAGSFSADRSSVRVTNLSMLIAALSSAEARTAMSITPASVCCEKACMRLTGPRSTAECMEKGTCAGAAVAADL